MRPFPSGVPAPARGDGGGSSRPKAVSPKQADPQYTNAVRNIQASKFAEAIPLLEQVVARDQANADAYNWLAYATRRNGEAYLALNDLPNAKQHLATLDSLCFFPCSEYSDLKKAIQEYERNGGAPKPSAGR